MLQFAASDSRSRHPPCGDGNYGQKVFTKTISALGAAAAPWAVQPALEIWLNTAIVMPRVDF
jgi:hypothetical protein